MTKFFTSILLVFFCAMGGCGGKNSNNDNEITSFSVNGGVSQVGGVPEFQVNLGDPITAKITYKNTDYSEIGNTYPQGVDSNFEITINGVQFSANSTSDKKYEIIVENNNQGGPPDLVLFTGADFEKSKALQVDIIQLELELFDTTAAILSDSSIPNTMNQSHYNEGTLKLFGYNVEKRDDGATSYHHAWSVQCNFDDFKITEN